MITSHKKAQDLRFFALFGASKIVEEKILKRYDEKKVP